jgi:hypothetical protein
MTTTAQPVDAATATQILADEAERRGATPNDDDGTVRALVAAHGLGFCAWFCVCCELADRRARAEGYTSQAHRAAAIAFSSKKSAQVTE